MLVHPRLKPSSCIGAFPLTVPKMDIFAYDWRSRSVRKLLRKRMCNNCGQFSADALQQCQACRVFSESAGRYCSRECQDADWPTHKPQCGSRILRALRAMQADSADR